MGEIQDLIEHLQEAEGPSFLLEQQIMWAVRDVPIRHRSIYDGQSVLKQQRI